ncbi:MAG TPA: ATP-binding protein [Phycisphaerae bacterium]|nr:ATP-binding protein [Phycisphaerae bacterium]
MITIELIYNLSILVAISVISSFISTRWKKSSHVNSALQGLLFGGAAIIGMFRPFVLAPGLFFDGRSVMISLCGLFFGPVSAAVACLMTIPCRIIQGGMGVRMGVLVILSSAIIGIVFRYRRKGGTADMSAWQLYVFGIVVHLAMLAMTSVLPSGEALKVLSHISLPCLGLYPLATVLIGKILTDHEKGMRLLKQLKLSEEQLRTLIENIPGAVYRCMASSPRFATHMSNNVVTVTGFKAEEFLHRRVNWADLVSPEDLPDVMRSVNNAILSRQPYEIEYRIKCRDGHCRWVQEKGRAVYSGNNEDIFLDGVILDITQRKKSEEERLRLEANLRHAQKMEAVGTLAAGIAHDFNNLLTAISGYTELAKADLPPGHPAHQKLDLVVTIVHDAGGIANSLLTFSRKTVSGKVRVNLTRVVVNSLKLLRRIIPAGVELRDSLKVDRPVYVLADMGQLHQVLMNLITNARDALPNGGAIAVGLSERNTPAGEKHAVLTVEDSGVGMSQEVASRIFDPFFTTKPRGKGTGLGMAIVHGIIEEHEGHIDIQSEPDKGTRVTVCLPTCGPPAPPPDESEAALPRASLKGLRILLAEDQDFVRAIMTDALQTAGFIVDESRDGTEALERFKAEPDACCLAILDIELPRMSGLQCYAEIRADRPDLPIVLVTGNPEYSVEGRHDEYLTLLRKPFTMSELTFLSKSMLAKQPGTGQEI